MDTHSHSSRRDWQRDRARQNALVRLGWRIYRVTWEDAARRRKEVVLDVAHLLEASRQDIVENLV